MKLTKHHKNIIKKILCGEIYDIFTYVTSLRSLRLAKYDREEVCKRFDNDSIPKTYYWRSDLERKKANVISEEKFIAGVNSNNLDPVNYLCGSLTLSTNSGIKEIKLDDKTFSFNFYEGVSIAKSFEDIIDFLSLCQFLQSEMLILTVPCDPCKEVIGLFFEEKTIDGNTTCDIDYNHLTCDDGYFFNGQHYVFSERNYTICSDYIKKRIYPTTRLHVFVDNNYNTNDEIYQTRTLFAAWIAIIISLLTSFYSIYNNLKDNNIYSVSQSLDKLIITVENIEDSLKTNHNDTSIIIDQIDNLEHDVEQLHETVYKITSDQKELLKKIGSLPQE